MNCEGQAGGLGWLTAVCGGRRERNTEGGLQGWKSTAGKTQGKRTEGERAGLWVTPWRGCKGGDTIRMHGMRLRGMRGWEGQRGERTR